MPGDLFPGFNVQHPSLPGWDEMTDLDKGAALLHLHKRGWEGADYAVENYPARYFDHPVLVALPPEESSAHAASLAADSYDFEVPGLHPDEADRLYDLALDADRKRLPG